jgi:imidazole glycerol phosphate synthase subunit HisF
MANRKTENSKQENENVETGMMPSLLVGYVRRSNAGGAIKLSINTNAFGDCETYTTSDGQTYASLVISLDAIRKVIDGDRAVTTVSQLIFD